MKYFKTIFCFTILSVFLLTFKLGVTDGSSMYPVMRDAHPFLYVEANSNISRFDIVTVEKDDELLVKRIVGVPGDEVILLNGRVIGVNKRFLPNTYISMAELKEAEIVKLEPNEYYMVGDNQANSIDSRHMGPISNEEIKGKVILGL